MAITKLDISMLEDVSGADNLVKLDANAKIPAGTGLREYNDVIVGSKEEYTSLLINKEESEEVNL